ncbi:protein PHYTOCHROME KINASE SUBSTRATE 3-like [Rutidosis leptorrhynchoides]|uniref:protein PHYTOCHROME KINASE SUBSTRATE 3-like n=1 Tax=Rutidosis leptorrhynchoides TaxID=125765 RepID=UPI003A98EB4D
METENNPNELRAASFSCYLKPAEGVANMFDTSEKFPDMSLFDPHKLKPSMFTPRTPSMSSTFSSNQGALLQPKPSSKAFVKRWFHGFVATCSTRNDVCVQQSVEQRDQFAFPVLTNDKQKVEDLPRVSIEVFGSGTLTKGDIARNLVRKMSILTWDAIPKSKESVICDDVASEASSDLFEIENISRTEWKDYESSVMSPSTQCAPSEASIEWSVVTASAAEYASVYSGYDEKHTVYNTRTTAKSKTGPTRKAQTPRTNGLLGCKGYESTNVAEPIHRSIEKPKR